MKRGLLFIIFILCGYFTQAQKTDETLKEYFLDAEFFFAQEEYVDALVDYMELYKNGYENNANLNYRIGICYLKIPGQKDKSIDYLLKAVQNVKSNNTEGKFRDEKAPMDAWLFLGVAYRVNYKLDKAIEAFQKYQEILPKKDETAREYIAREIEACHKAKEFIQNPSKAKLVNLGDSINGSSSNYKAVLSGDGKSIFFMNELPFYDAVYYSILKNGRWTTPVNITPQIQSDGNQFVSSVSYDGKTLYLTYEDDFNSDIWISWLKDSVWSKSEPVKGAINTRFWESHASISKDGKTLYFASNQKGIGAMDIYKSEIGNDNLWGQPVNMGSVINTPVNEDTPFITEDGNTLYFSSQGHNGMGGYDLYRSKKDENGNWSQPENLGYPLNTTDDDLFYFPWQNGEYALISTFDLDGFGKEDIYEVQHLNGSMLKFITANEKISSEAFEKQHDTLNVASIQTEVPVQNVTDDTNSVETTEKIENITKEDNLAEKVEVPIEEVNKKSVSLNPVYYGFDSSIINESGKQQLDKVVVLLKEMNTLVIELVGYADAIGPAKYNALLSEKRAVSALNYLKGKGVPSERIKTRGLGETNFAAINSNPDGTDNPEGRKYNRRVEIEFSGEGSENIEIESEEVPENLKSK